VRRGVDVGKNPRGRKPRAGERAKAAQPSAGLPRAFHLQNCSLLQEMYREEGWIDRPSSGEKGHSKVRVTLCNV